MTSQQKIIKFMQAKKRKITKLLGVKGSEYFNEKDVENISNIEDSVADGVWSKIKNNFIANTCYGLDGDSCPFCYLASYIYENMDLDAICSSYEDRCTFCLYSCEHGDCNKEDSAYENILWEAYDQDIGLEEKFSNDYYRKLIKRIEKGD